MSEGLSVLQIELRVHNLDAAMSFYGSVFSWGIYPSSASYALVDTGLLPVVGILHDPRIPTGISPLIRVQDCQAAVQKAKDLGGRVFIQTAEIAGSGAFTAALDPWGNLIYFWQPYSDGKPRPEREPINPFVFIEIATPNVEKATRYYSQLMGWSFWNVPSEQNYAIAEGNGLKRGIGLYGADANSSGMVCYIQVNNLEETAQKIKAAGGQVVVPPDKFLGEGRYLIFADPTGNRVGAFEPQPSS
jgi:predicted enzyme related to lactoylglutathione lyase